MVGFGVLGFEVLCQSIQAGAPEWAVVGQPLVGFVKDGRVEADDLKAAAALAGDQLGCLEDFEVLGDGGQGESVGTGEVADGLFARRDIVEDGATGGVGEGVEDGIESGGVRLNHMVECSAKPDYLSTDWLNVLASCRAGCGLDLYARKG